MFWRRHSPIDSTSHHVLQTASTIAYLDELRSAYVSCFEKHIAELVRPEVFYELLPTNTDGYLSGYENGWPVRFDYARQDSSDGWCITSISGQEEHIMPQTSHVTELLNGAKVSIQYCNWNRLIVTTDLDCTALDSVLEAWLIQHIQVDVPKVVYPAIVPHEAVPAQQHAGQSWALLDLGTASAELLWELFCALETAGAHKITIGPVRGQPDEVVAALWDKQIAARHKLMYTWNSHWSEPFPKDLVTQVVKKIETENRGMHYSHRDYCGMGISYNKELQQFELGYVADGYGLSPVLKTFATSEALITWLTQQSNKTLSGCFEAYDFYESDGSKKDNQRITRHMLERYLTKEGL